MVADRDRDRDRPRHGGHGRPDRPPGDRFAAAHVDMLVVNGIDVRHVQEAVSADAEIDEGRLNARLDVDDPPLINVVHITFLARSFDIKFFESSVFHNGDAAFLRLEDVDEHFLLHENLSQLIRRPEGIGTNPVIRSSERLLMFHSTIDPLGEAPPMGLGRY